MVETTTIQEPTTKEIVIKIEKRIGLMNVHKLHELCQENNCYKQIIFSIYKEAILENKKINIEEMLRTINVGEKNAYYYLERLQCLRMYQMTISPNKTLPKILVVIPLRYWSYEVTEIIDYYLNEDYA